MPEKGRYWLWRGQNVGTPFPISRALSIANYFFLFQSPSSSSSSSFLVDFFMATDNKQKEEPRSRKPRLRRNLEMEELPTFTKWLTSFGHSASCNDANSKSKPVNANRLPVKAPVVVLDSSEDGVAVVGDVPKENRVQAVDDSISAGAGCCCWQSYKSTRRECGFRFHFSLRKRMVVTNASDTEVVAAVSNPQEEEAVVANASETEVVATASKLREEKEAVVVVGDVHDNNGCGCRCLPTFQICGRRKSTVVATSDLQKEEGAVTEVPKLRKEELATSGPDSVKEGEVVVAPDLPKEEGSGCCCGRWGWLPSFQICRRKVVAAGEEEVIVDAPKVEELANDNVNKQETDSVGSYNPKTLEKKEAEAFNDSSNADVPNPGKEEKVVVGVSVPPEKGVVAADKEKHSKSAQGGICWPFQICAGGWLPRFSLCRGRTAVDTSNHREEEEKAPPDVRKEEEIGTVIPDPHKENNAAADGIPDHGKEKHVAADDIPVHSTEEKMSAAACETLDLHKEENVSSRSIQDVRKEEEMVDSGVSDLGQEEEESGCGCFKIEGKEGGRRQRRRSARSREGGWAFLICGRGWLPILGLCRGSKKITVSESKLHEEGLVNNGVSEVHNEVVDVAGAKGVVAAASDHSKPTRGCGCWHSEPRRRRAVAVDKDGGSGRHLRRRGWLRRCGRKQIEGKRKR